VQAAQLHHDEEQAERPRADRDEEVLPVRPAAHHAQGDALRRSAAPAVEGAGDPDLADLAELVKLAKRGDDDAFERLVVATFSDLYALAYRLVGNADDASDVVQEAYLRAYRYLRKFRGDASFRTWTYRITANCAATLLARRARTRQVELDDELPLADLRPERDPEAAANATADRDRLVGALGELPETLRLVVVLRDVYDLPHEDIARELGISPTAAKVRLHRARRRLREQLFPVAAQSPAGTVPATVVAAPIAQGGGETEGSLRAV
jgi:RNA polymerase sigma-70 factor (ECF subfamily)